ncbi:MAG: TetR/AcrR family transcriptional regulator [Pseudonocardiaceae bacterium]
MATRRTSREPARQRERDTAPLRRADAERNIAAIVEAGLELFSMDGNVTMTQVARTAGVGRVTLYAHFPSRADLLDAVVARAISQATVALDADDLASTPPDQAVGRLLRTSWRLLDRFRRLKATAQAELGEQRLRRHHDRALQHVEALIARGQDCGLFRTDLPLGWLVTTFYAVLHAGADEVDAGRLPAAEAPDVLTATVLSLLRPADDHRSDQHPADGPR